MLFPVAVDLFSPLSFVVFGFPLKDAEEGLRKQGLIHPRLNAVRLHAILIGISINQTRVKIKLQLIRK